MCAKKSIKKKIAETGTFSFVPVDEAERRGMLDAGNGAGNIRFVVRRAVVYPTRYAKYPATYTALLVYWYDVYNIPDRWRRNDPLRSITFNLYISRETRGEKVTWVEQTTNIPSFEDEGLFGIIYEWGEPEWGRVVERILESTVRKAYKEDVNYRKDYAIEEAVKYYGSKQRQDNETTRRQAG